ncbi:MAG: aromatic ring-hydroxylating dioxygenase subunit alpha [Alphaproteobacteria bacterium]|nr:aromatic ring-hydroxylating dioxygenase subunit alpha [Alphaproteobacteria bacterium]
MGSDRQRWATLYPELGTGPVSTEPCISPAFYEREKERVFKKVWLKVARDEELPKPGDWKVKKLHFADTSIILIRGKDGVVRGYHNICSHRGNQVIVEHGDEMFGANRAAVVTCRFHGWVYDAHGKLVHVPSEERFYACFEKEKNGLTAVRTDTWEGFVFVNLDPDGRESLRDYLGAYAEHMRGFPYGELDSCHTYHTYLRCNWKVAHDAFAEAYHVDTIHAGTLPNVFSTGLANVKLFGPHRTSAVCLRPGEHFRPVQKIADAIGGGYTVIHHRATMLPLTINPDHRTDFSFELSVLFPNLLIHVSEGLWFTHQFWPLAHNLTRWEGKYYARKPLTNSQAWALHSAQILFRNAWLEDTGTMEATQVALSSGVRKVMNLQDDEVLVRHGYHVLDRYVNA